MRVSRFFKPFDCIIYGILFLLICLLLPVLFGKPKGATALLTYDGGSKRLPLSVDATEHISSGGHTLTVVVQDGTVFVQHADCPDRICVQTGPVSSSGASIVCLPARVCIVVEGEQAEVDDVAR